MPDNKTKTYVLDGKTYTVPADTSMEELDQFIRGQSGPRPIQDTSTLSKPPSLLSRLGSAFARGGPVDAGEELGNATREAIGGYKLPGVNKTLGEGLTDLGYMANMAGTEASLLQAPQLGESLVSGLPRLGTKAASLLRKPATPLQSMRGEPGAVKDILPPTLQKWTLPPSMVPKGELGTPTNPGPFNAIPNRLPPNLRGDPFAGPSTPRLGTGGANVYPEPRAPMPGDRPGAAWSQGRESTLPASAQRGAPGAVDVLRNIGKPIVLTPRSGIGYPSPGEFEAMREPLLGRSTPYQGAPQLRPEVQQMAIPSAASRVPEWRAGQVDAEMSRLQSILRNPQATMEEKNIAQSQLQNYQSRPRF